MTTQTLSRRGVMSKAWWIENKSLVALLVLIAVVSFLSPNFLPSLDVVRFGFLFSTIMSIIPHFARNVNPFVVFYTIKSSPTSHLTDIMASIPFINMGFVFLGRTYISHYTITQNTCRPLPHPTL